jgi:UDP-2,3-diacylglucosamine pyrophosphatase LpxH
MRTAIVSDLHLGAAAGEDVLRDAGVRRVLLEELAGADRVVLLGDVVELRDLALGVAMASARPFFEELGEALGDRDVAIVPGNHDHRLAEPLLDRLSLAGQPALGLQQRDGPSAGPTAQIDEWLGAARLELAYPGLWLRDDVYATHGHYMDAHLSLPRAECVAAAALIRISSPLPSPATPSDYERVLRPLYGFSFGIAQARGRTARARTNPSEAAWRTLSGSRNDPSEGVWKALSGRGSEDRPSRRLAGAGVRAAFPAGVWALNRLLRSSFEADVSAAAIFAGGVEGATEMAARLGVDGAHVITGHTHRGGPRDGESEWPLPDGGSLHNTGSWVFASAFHHPGTPPSPYWPGTITWVEDSGPPRRVQLLLDRSHEEMLELVSKASPPASRR